MEERQSMEKRPSMEERHSRDFGSSIADKYKLEHWYTLKYPELVHLWKKDEKEGIGSQGDFRTLWSDTKTEKVISKEIRSIVRMNYVYKQRLLIFDDIRRLFKSLTLEEEKEFSTFLNHFLSDSLMHLQKTVWEEQEQMKQLRTAVAGLDYRMKEWESSIPWETFQRENRNREESSGPDEDTLRKLTEAIMEQMQKQLKLERIRRGY